MSDFAPGLVGLTVRGTATPSQPVWGSRRSGGELQLELAGHRRPRSGWRPRPELTLARAREHLEAAVDTLRKAGRQDELPKGLLTRAWLHHLEGRPNLAHADLDEAWSIAERGPMPLFQADIQLHRARLFHDRSALAAATTLIQKHGYARRLPELEDAQRSATTWP